MKRSNSTPMFSSSQLNQHSLVVSATSAANGSIVHSVSSPKTTQPGISTLDALRAIYSRLYSA